MSDDRVKPLSNVEVEKLAEAWHDALVDKDDLSPDVFQMLERAKEYKLTQDLEIISIPDDQMGDKLAYAVPELKRIFVRDSVANGAKRKVRRDRMTIMHEFGHVVLHPGNIARPRLALESERTTKAYESAEHQTKLFAAAILMPRKKIKHLTSPAVIAEKCQVSLEAATIRFKQVCSRRIPTFVKEMLATRLTKPTLVPTSIQNFNIPRKKTEIEQIWESAAIAPGEDPAEYRLSVKGYLVKRSEYLKMTECGWFANGKVIHAHMETGVQAY